MRGTLSRTVHVAQKDVSMGYWAHIGPIVRVIREKLHSQLADQASKGIPDPVSKPLQGLPPTRRRLLRQKHYAEVEGYKFPSSLVREAHTFGDHSSLSLPC